MEATKRRFASLSSSETENLMDGVDSKNTKRQTNTAINIFREYLTEKNLPLEFEKLNEEELDGILSKFYLEIRTKNGELYKKTTMNSYRQGIQRHLSKYRDIDILKGSKFKQSASAFKGMAKELKRQGLSAIEHYPTIAEADMEKMYNYLCSDLNNIQKLQHKVFVDIMIHFGRRGRKNLSNLTRRDFAVSRDPDGALYVYKTKDESTKNHQMDEAKSSDGRMYEVKDSDRCPVRSFVRYIRRLNPKCDKLFQQARLVPKDNVYFDNIALGHNKLGKFMNDISTAAGLSQIYTNHSCRATTVHLLDEAQIPSRHIMSVTGHKAESSLKTYSGKTSDRTKRIMSETLSKSMACKQTSTVTSPPLSSNTTCTTSSCVTNNIDFLCLSQSSVVVEQVTEAEVPQFNLNSDLVPLSSSQEAMLNNLLNQHDQDNTNTNILKTIDNNVVTTLSDVVKESTSGVLSAPAGPMPVLNNCSNITFNYNFYLKN